MLSLLPTLTWYWIPWVGVWVWVGVLDTIDQWFADHDKGKITVTMYDILIICGIITVILTLGEYGALCMLDVYGAILLITFQNMC